MWARGALGAYVVIFGNGDSELSGLQRLFCVMTRLRKRQISE
jgi:hypothetical protein